MSLTKRYLESLPADEQDAILGGVDNAYISPDEWSDDAENEPGIDPDYEAWQSEREAIEEKAEWARALMEEEEEA